MTESHAPRFEEDRWTIEAGVVTTGINRGTVLGDSEGLADAVKAIEAVQLDPTRRVIVTKVGDDWEPPRPAGLVITGVWNGE